MRNSQDSLPRSKLVRNPVRQDQENVTYLVTIAPRVVLGADVLVGVLHTLLKRGHVSPVLPMLLPEVVGIGATKDEARNHSARLKVRVELRLD